MPVYSRETGALRTPRLPRLGIIRLGFKETRKRPNGQEYSFPRAAEHFVLEDAPDVAQVFGEEPGVLATLVIPGEDDEVVASHWLRNYSITWGLTCIGNGQSANRLADKAILDRTGEAQHANHNSKETVWTPVTCPCPLLESGDCRETMYLRFVLPTVPGLGVWQISTGSSNSIKNIQGTLTMLRSLTGRISGHLLKLSLVEQEVFSEQGGRKTVRVLRLDPSGSVSMLDIIERVKSLGPSTFMPLIALPPSQQETAPDDLEEAGEVAQPEAEEAEYLNKAELASEEEVEQFERFLDEDTSPSRRQESPEPAGQPPSPEASRPAPGRARAKASAAPAPKLKSTSELFKLCWAEHGLQPDQVIKMAGYERATDMIGMEFNEIYLKVQGLAKANRA